MTELERLRSRYYPTWSHYIQDKQQHSDLLGRYGFLVYFTLPDGGQKLLALNATTMVVRAPTFFQPEDRVIPIKILAHSDKWGVGFLESFWLTRKGGIFKKDALPENELMREVFLTKYLEELEK